MLLLKSKNPQCSHSTGACLCPQISSGDRRGQGSGRQGSVENLQVSQALDTQAEEPHCKEEQDGGQGQKQERQGCLRAAAALRRVPRPGGT